MAAAPVQTSAQTQVTATSADITVSSTGLNNLVVVHVRINSLTETVDSITDNVGNTYVVGTGASQGTSTIYQGYGVQTISGATTITVTTSASVNITCGADEFSGTATSNAAVIDDSGSGAGTGTSASVTGLTPSAAGKLIVATARTSSIGSWSAGTNYTLYFNGSSQPRALMSEYRLSGTTSETAPATNTVSGDWSEIARSYNLSSGANTRGFFAIF